MFHPLTGSFFFLIWKENLDVWSKIHKTFPQHLVITRVSWITFQFWKGLLYWSMTNLYPWYSEQHQEIYIQIIQYLFAKQGTCCSPFHSHKLHSVSIPSMQFSKPLPGGKLCFQSQSCLIPQTRNGYWTRTLHSPVWTTRPMPWGVQVMPWTSQVQLWERLRRWVWPSQLSMSVKLWQTSQWLTTKCLSTWTCSSIQRGQQKHVWK